MARCDAVAASTSSSVAGTLVDRSRPVGVEHRVGRFSFAYDPTDRGWCAPRVARVLEELRAAGVDLGLCASAGAVEVRHRAVFASADDGWDAGQVAAMDAAVVALAGCAARRCDCWSGPAAGARRRAGELLGSLGWQRWLVFAAEGDAFDPVEGLGLVEGRLDLGELWDLAAECAGAVPAAPAAVSVAFDGVRVAVRFGRRGDPGSRSVVAAPLAGVALDAVLAAKGGVGDLVRLGRAVARCGDDMLAFAVEVLSDPSRWGWPSGWPRRCALVELLGPLSGHRVAAEVAVRMYPEWDGSLAQLGAAARLVAAQTT